MRIAYLTGEYPRATDTFIQREVAALRELGEEVHTIAVRRPKREHLVGPEQQAEYERTFYVLPPKPGAILSAHASLLRTPARYFKALALAWKTRQPGLAGLIYQLFYFAEAGVVAQYIRKLGIEHLHNHFANSSCSVSMLAAELGGFSYSFTLHGPAIFFEPHRWRLDEKIRRARFVSCISHFCRSQGMIFAPMEMWPQMHIVHCGVNPALFTPVTHEGEGKRLLYVGRLAAVKGLPVLLDALAGVKTQFPDCVLTVVGDGEDRKTLEKRATELGLQDHVRFIGYQSQAQVREHIQQTDVFVMSSFAEGVPVVLMEAMAAGVPVVATRIAGVGELVEDGVSGFLTPPGDNQTLGDRIGALLADSALRQQMGDAGRRQVEAEFDIAKEARWLHRIMTSALRGEIQPVRDAAHLPAGDVNPPESTSCASDSVVDISPLTTGSRQ